MKIWLPYVHGGSGTDVFTQNLARGLQAAGHEAIPQAFAHNWQYFPWRLRAVSAPPGTDIVLANTWSGFAFQRTGAKLITVQHHLVLDPALSPYKNFAQQIFHHTLVWHFECASKKASDIQVAVSQYSARIHQKILGGDKLPKVILNGIDTKFFCPSPKGKEPLGRRPVRLLFVGNLTQRKGADLLPALMENLGDGYELAYVVGLRTGDAFPKSTRMRSLGRLSTEELRDAYREADLFIFPSRLEGFGLAVCEALACGTPAIVTNTSALPEVVEQGVTGILCPLDDIQSFTTAIRSTVRDSENYVAMTMAARNVAVSRFSQHRMVNDYIRLFETLVGSPHRSTKF